jgi:hypothetical protein
MREETSQLRIQCAHLAAASTINPLTLQGCSSHVTVADCLRASATLNSKYDLAAICGQPAEQRCYYSADSVVEEGSAGTYPVGVSEFSRLARRPTPPAPLAGWLLHHLPA